MFYFDINFNENDLFLSFTVTGYLKYFSDNYTNFIFEYDMIKHREKRKSGKW